MERKSDINVTPYIDILLVMLIIFMVISSTQTRGLETRLPETLQDPPPGPSTFAIVIEPLSDGSWLINKRAVADGDFESALQHLMAQAPRHDVFVGAGEWALYGDIVRALDRARGAGADRLSLMLTRVP